MTANLPKFLCLTFHGTVLCVEDNQLSHQPYCEKSQGKYVYFEMVFDQTNSKADVQALGLAAADAFSQSEFRCVYKIISTGDGRLVHIDTGWGYLCARPEGGMPIHQGPPQGWETFIFLTVEEMNLIDFVSRNDWSAGSDFAFAKNSLILKESIKLTDEFHFKFGDVYVGLKQGPCLLTETLCQSGDEFVSVAILQDGWDVIACATIFRPLIYYTAFGSSDVFLQMQLSIKSAVVFGKFSGDICVITDKDESFVLKYIPSEFVGRAIVHKCLAIDYIDFCLARYKIYDCREAKSYQPLLYVDTDIAFDSNIGKCLFDIYSSDRICAALETQDLQTADSLGAFLFKQTGTMTDGKSGFNAGCLGLPSLLKVEWFLRLVVQVANKYIAVHGRKALWLADQPVANYLAIKLFPFDLGPISKSTRVGTLEITTDSRDCLGMVHFWPQRGQAAKRQALSNFVDRMSEEI